MKLASVILCIWTLSACVVSKEERNFKKETKEWRESAIKLQGYSDSPLTGTFLTLRENGKFEHTSSGMFQSFRAGSWTYSSDTIHLQYRDLSKVVIHSAPVFIDRQTNTLQFINDTSTVVYRLNILNNEL